MVTNPILHDDSLAVFAQWFWAQSVRGEDGCWRWHGRQGYSRVYVGGGRGQGVFVYAHRLAWMLTRGSIPEDLVICHHCDVPSCVRPAHLFLGTQGDNQRDAMRKGRHGPPAPVRGERNHSAKLTVPAVQAIRVAIKAGERLRPVAQRYGVSMSLISRVARHRIWQHVADPPVRG